MSEYGEPGGWGVERDARQPVRIGPMTLGDLIDNAFRLLRADLGIYLLVVGAIVIPTTLLLTLLTGDVTGGPTNIFDPVDPELAQVQAEQDLRELGASLAAFAGITLVQSLLLIAAAAAVAWIAARRLRGRDSSAGDALKLGLRKLGWLVLASLVRYLVPGLLLLVAGLLTALLVALLDTVGGVVGGLLVLAAVVAGAWWLVATALLVPALVIEELGPVQALRRSVRLVRGSWWRVFGILLLAGLVLGLVGGVVGVLPGVLSGVVPIAAVALTIQAVAGILTGIIVEPLETLLSVLLYADLRSRREGLDVAQQAGLPDTEWSAG